MRNILNLNLSLSPPRWTIRACLSIIALVLVMMLHLGLASESEKAIQGFRHLLDLSFVELTDVVEVLLITKVDEVDGNSLPPKPPATADAVDVVFTVCR